MSLLTATQYSTVGTYQNLFNHSPVFQYYKQCCKEHPGTSLHAYEDIFIGQIPAVEFGGSKSTNIFGVIDFAKWSCKNIVPCYWSTNRIGKKPDLTHVIPASSWPGIGVLRLPRKQPQCWIRSFWAGSSLAPSLPKAQVQSLVGELRFHKLRAEAEKKKKFLGR